MNRRDKHPLLRALSAPLKLVLDILDLAWDQTSEFVLDVWGVAKSWSVRPVKWAWAKARNIASATMSRLTDLRNKLGKKAE
jgi:hypothetical protein